MIMLRQQIGNENEFKINFMSLILYEININYILWTLYNLLVSSFCYSFKFDSSKLSSSPSNYCGWIDYNAIFVML